MVFLSPDSPQGWPASSYTRATVYYLDGDGRTVNVASPGGSISTTEYNSKNDPVRSLAGGARAKAPGRRPKSVEVAQLLDTQEHLFRRRQRVAHDDRASAHRQLANGSQVLARHRVTYAYDEGAPLTGGPYHLVTKLTEGALLTGGTESDVHTTVNSYSGQENLGSETACPHLDHDRSVGLETAAHEDL